MLETPEEKKQKLLKYWRLGYKSNNDLARVTGYNKNTIAGMIFRMTRDGLLEPRSDKVIIKTRKKVEIKKKEYKKNSVIGWTDDLVSELKFMLREGKAIHYIAEELGKTPSSIRDKIKRLKLIREEETKIKSEFNIQNKPIQNPINNTFLSFSEEGISAMYYDHKRQCGWVNGYNREKMPMYCGLPIVEKEKPYCVEHDKICNSVSHTKKPKEDFPASQAK